MESFIGVTLGWVGTVGTFSAYILIWRGWADSTALHYSLLNAAGGFMAGAGAFAYGAWPAFASNFVWGLIGLLGVVTALRRRAAQRREARDSARLKSVGPVHTYEWDPTQTQASSIVLPWLENSRPGEIRLSREANGAESGRSYAVSSGVVTPVISMPPTQPMQIAC